MLEIFNYLGEIFNVPPIDGKGLKSSTPNQMLNKLPITLARLKAGNKNLKMKLDNCLIFCTDQKNLQNNCIKVSLTLFKNGNNLYEHSK